jgi:hypothetical protein
MDEREKRIFEDAFGPYDIHKLIDEAEEKRGSELDLKARKKEDLIAPVLFNVLNYKSESYLIYHSNERFGSGYSSRIIGTIPKKVLEVDSEIPEAYKIRELVFYGFDSFEHLDKIKAYIHKYEIEKGKLLAMCGCHGESREELFIERDFNKREVVSRIDKFYRNGDFYELKGIDTNGKEVW